MPFLEGKLVFKTIAFLLLGLTILSFAFVFKSVFEEVHYNVFVEVNYDWRFHSCFAGTADAWFCSGSYENYAGLTHFPAWFLSKIVGLKLFFVFALEWVLVLGVLILEEGV